MTKIVTAVVWSLVFLIVGNGLSAEIQTQPKSIKTMTQGQIENAVNSYRALLEKHAEQFDEGAVQMALDQFDLAREQYEVFRRHVEMFSRMIVCKVKVNRSRTLQEAIAATECVGYLDDKVIETIPRGITEEVEVCFVPLAKHTSAKDVQKILDDRGLKSDPYALLAVNQLDSDFAKKHPNGTQWLDGSGKYCYMVFCQWHSKRYVFCGRDRYLWDDYWWIGGVRK